MTEEEKTPHVLVVPFPTQAHINPMLQFSNRLVSKGVMVTIALTDYLYNSALNQLFTIDGSDVDLTFIADGYDGGGFKSADTFEAYLASFKELGMITLSERIEAKANYGKNPFTCIVYDSFLPWVLDVARNYDIAGGPFFTQSYAVNDVLYSIYGGKLSLPVSSGPVEISGLLALDVGDLPLFTGHRESYPASLELLVNQSVNLKEADFALINSYYQLEDKVVDSMSSEYPLLPIGPTIPSFYLDDRVKDNKKYGLDLFHMDEVYESYYADNSARITDWLLTKPPKSVAYVSFGPETILPNTQMEELAWGLIESGPDILWVVPESEEDKLPLGFVEQAGDKVLVVKWCTQLEVLANEAVACFLTHCGWNSTLEALSLGVPMIGMPQWLDQPTNAKLIEDVWKVGVRVQADKEGIVPRGEIQDRVKEVMVGDRSEEIKENANKWKELSKEVVSEGGSSDVNIDEFVSKLGKLVMGVPGVEGVPKWNAYDLLHS